MHDHFPSHFPDRLARLCCGVSLVRRFAGLLGLLCDLRRLPLPTAALACMLTTAAPGAARPSAPRDADELPEAAALLDRFVEVTGGKKAHLALDRRRSTGTLAIDMAGHQLDAKFVRHEQAPGCSQLRIESDFFHQISATNGQQAWEWRPQARHEEDGSEALSHTRRLQGLAREQLIEQAQFHGAVHWRQHLTKVETLRVVDLDGRPAYEVRVSPKGGAPYSRFYDQQSGHLVRSLRLSPSPHHGELEVDSRISDYREFDGVWLPTRVLKILKPKQGEPGTQLWVYEEIRHDLKVPKSLFQVPDELEGQAGVEDGATLKGHAGQSDHDHGKDQARTDQRSTQR